VKSNWHRGRKRRWECSHMEGKFKEQQHMHHLGFWVVFDEALQVVDNLALVEVKGKSDM